MSKFSRLLLIASLMLTVILLMVLTAVFAAGMGYTRVGGLTVTPLFDDPRLAETVTLPSIDYESADPTAMFFDMLSHILEDEFAATIGVRACHFYPSSTVTVRGSCTVGIGMDRPAMAELLRQLAERYVPGITLDLMLSDGENVTRYIWDSSAEGWQIAPLSRSPYNDMRLALNIAYNPPPNGQRTVPPATPDPRPYDERILTAFEDTEGVQSCTLTLDENPHPPNGYMPGQVAQVIVSAECNIEPGFNTVEQAEWLRRLTTRALLDTNSIGCEDMTDCDKVLAQPMTTLVLDDGSARIEYTWDGRAWMINIIESTQAD